MQGMQQGGVNSNLLRDKTVNFRTHSYSPSECSQTCLESHYLQHLPLYNNTHGRNGFNGLCTKCPGYNNNSVIAVHYSGTKGVVVDKFDCTHFLSHMKC